MLNGMHVCLSLNVWMDVYYVPSCSLVRELLCGLGIFLVHDGPEHLLARALKMQDRVHWSNLLLKRKRLRDVAREPVDQELGTALLSKEGVSLQQGMVSGKGKRKTRAKQQKQQQQQRKATETSE